MIATGNPELLEALAKYSSAQEGEVLEKVARMEEMGHESYLDAMESKSSVVM